MSSAPINTDCSLCWANGKLAGGRVLAEGEQLFAYVFEREDGTLKYALIATKEHHADMRNLTPSWGIEFGAFYGHVLGLLDGKPHNGYWNDGQVAGQRIMGHWHVRVEPRQEGQPSSGMGLGLLISKYDELIHRVATHMTQCTDPELTAALPWVNRDKVISPS